MAIYNLSETKIPKMFSEEMYDRGWDMTPSITDDVAEVFINGTSYALKDAKSTEIPTAMVFEAPNGDMYAGAVVRYIPSQDPDMPGSWSYIWTFDKDDIPENCRILRSSDTGFHSYFRTMSSSFFFGFSEDSSITDMGNCIFKAISHWLQENAKPDEEVGVELEGVFRARCVIEDNEVKKSMELIGEAKAIIKDDQAIEV